MSSPIFKPSPGTIVSTIESVIQHIKTSVKPVVPRKMITDCRTLLKLLQETVGNPEPPPVKQLKIDVLYHKLRQNIDLYNHSLLAKAELMKFDDRRYLILNKVEFIKIDSADFADLSARFIPNS